MKKAICWIVSLWMIVSCIGFSVYAEEASVTAKVYVTITDGSGKLVLTQEAITAKDRNGDGAVDTDEVFYATHEEKYPDGADAGYASLQTTYFSIQKLWGVANGGSYGYYINQKAASDLSNLVQDGDYVDAFIYQDLTSWSDQYTYFDKRTAQVKQGETLSVTLSGAGFDANWNPTVLPIAGAVITMNGEKTSYITASDGTVTIPFNTAGEVTISAVSDSAVLVPPVLKVSVEAVETKQDAETKDIVASPKTGDNTAALVWLGLISSLVILTFSIKKFYEA